MAVRVDVGAEAAEERGDEAPDFVDAGLRVAAAVDADEALEVGKERRAGGREVIAQAMELAGRLRAGVAVAAIPTAGPGTVSLGVSQLAAGETASALLQRADEAMYCAKSGGRNRVEAAAPA